MRRVVDAGRPCRLDFVAGNALWFAQRGSLVDTVIGRAVVMYSNVRDVSFTRYVASLSTLFVH
jgi:hypothetical protein